MSFTCGTRADGFRLIQYRRRKENCFLDFSGLFVYFSYLHVHHKYTDTDEDKYRHSIRYIHTNTAIYYSQCQQLGSKLLSTGISQVTPPPTCNRPLPSSYHISQIIPSLKLNGQVHILSSLSLNNYHMPVCALKTVVFYCCNHSLCSYWPFLVSFHLNDETQNPQSSFCVKIYSKVYLRLMCSVSSSKWISF